MSDTSFISHRMFVAALERDQARREKTRLAGPAKSDSPPAARGAVPYRKEVMAAALARQLLGRPMDMPHGI